MSAHTPGPWRRQIVAPTFEHTAIQTEDGKKSIARVFSRGTDARLIAAAPELLEALEALMSQTIAMDERYGVALSEGEHEAALLARAAIAKAKGN